MTASETRRLEVLRGYSLATFPGDPAFDRITALMAKVFDVPIALVTLIDEKRQWFKSKHGLETMEAPRALAFCDHAIRSDDVMIVTDATHDPRFKDSPYVKGSLGVRFYAGAPLIAVEGARIGTVCLFDRRPRSLTAAQRDLLAQLSQFVMSLIELRLEALLASSVRDELAAVIDASPQAILTRAEDGTIASWNEEATRLFGYARDEALGQRPNLFVGDGRGETFRRVVAEGSEIKGERARGIHKSGRLFDVAFSAKPILGGDARTPVGAAYVVDDVSDLVRQRRIERLRAAVFELVARAVPIDRIFRALVDLVEASIAGSIGCIFRTEGERLRYVAIGDGMPRHFIDAIDGIVIGPDRASCGTAAYRKETVIVSDVETDPLFVRIRSKALEFGLRAAWSTPILAPDGRVFGTVGIYARTEREPTAAELLALEAVGAVASIAMGSHEARTRLEEMVVRDSLTQLPNRVGFERELAREFELARANGTKFAVGVLGLNRFKTINDSLGHAAGDALLKEIAARLRIAMRPRDAFARLGSDEFVFLVSDMRSRDEAESVARRIGTTLDRSLIPDGEEIFVRATVGLSVFPDDADEASQLLRLADAAMRSAKLRNDRFAFHAGPRSHDGRVRLSLESNLSRALVHREFRLEYQPIVSLATKQAVGVEALLRWDNPALGRVAPDVFVPLAEELGLIVPIGAWVLEEACAFGRRWLAAGGTGDVAVNVSARQFETGDFARVVASALEISGLPATHLTLEITESLIMRSPETTSALLGELRALGVRCAIDDFGTGYSSLQRLTTFPVDALKIDRSFLGQLDVSAPDAKEATLIRAIIGVGSSMGLGVIAEGVETEAQRTFLLDNECRYAQGYLFARPMPEDALIASAWGKRVP